MTIWTPDYFKSLAERVLASAVGALLAFFAVEGFDPRTADWSMILTATGVAAAVSLLKGLLANVATKTGPSLTDSEQVIPFEPQPKNKVNGV